jgi:hypothetical protein
MTIVIIVENIGSSSVATHTARRFLVAYKKLMDRREREAYETSKTNAAPKNTSSTPILSAIPVPPQPVSADAEPANAEPANAV